MPRTQAPKHTGPLDLDGRCGACLLFGAIEGLADGLVLVDPKGRIFHINRRARELLGLSAARAAGARLREVLRQPALSSFWSAALRRDGPLAAEIPFSQGLTLRASVSGCLSASGEPLGRALHLRDITRENRVRVELSASVARRIVQMAGEDDGRGDAALLTRREREILQLLAGGLPNAAIAERLGVSVNTVATHLKHLFAKLGVHNRSQAAAFAVARGMRPPRSQ